MTESVSVLIPAKGYLRYISFALESISVNRVKPYEVLIIDDGIHDSSHHEIQESENKLNIQIIRNSGKGLVDALNLGIDKCKTAYIARLDCDDMMASNRIETQLQFLESNQHVSALGSQCIYIDEQGKEVGLSRYPVGSLNDVQDFTNRCLVCHPSTMFRSSAAKIIGGYRSIFTWNDVDIAEDFDFWLRLSKGGVIWNTNEPLTYYRQHNEQISIKSNLGQLLGTPYVSSAFKLSLNPPKKIRFDNFVSQNKRFYLKIIKQNYGFITAQYLNLLLITFDKFLFRRKMPKMITRFLVSRVASSLQI